MLQFCHFLLWLIVLRKSFLLSKRHIFPNIAALAFFPIPVLLNDFITIFTFPTAKALYSHPPSLSVRTLHSSSEMTSPLLIYILRSHWPECSWNKGMECNESSRRAVYQPAQTRTWPKLYLQKWIRWKNRALLSLHTHAVVISMTASAGIITQLSNKTNSFNLTVKGMWLFLNFLNHFQFTKSLWEWLISFLWYLSLLRSIA